MKTVRVPTKDAAANEQRVCRAIEAKFPGTKYPRSGQQMVGGLLVTWHVTKHVEAVPVEGDPTQRELQITGPLESASTDNAAMDKLNKNDRNAIRALVASAPPDKPEEPEEPKGTGSSTARLVTKLLLALALTSCAAARQDPCAPLWGTAIATSTLAASGAMLVRADTDQDARNAEEVATIVLSSATIVAVGYAARCESLRTK